MNDSRTPRKFTQNDLRMLIRLIPLLGSWKLVLVLIAAAAFVRYAGGLGGGAAGKAKPAGVEAPQESREPNEPASKPVVPADEGAKEESRSSTSNESENDPGDSEGSTRGEDSGVLGIADLSDEKMRVPGMVIEDQEGKVLYRGTVDLKPTLVRIDQGKRLSYRNDGSVFQNRERRIPREASGHYREWVHPTKGFSGPGPQRVVTGKNREIYYTPDHYDSFVKIR